MALLRDEPCACYKYGLFPSKVNAEIAVVAISKSAYFFLINDSLVRWHISQLCTPGSGLTNSGRLTSGKGYPALAQCVRLVIRSDLQ